MLRKTWVFILIAAVIGVLAFGSMTGCGTTKKNIVDTATKDGRFTTLVSALQAAGLVDTLNGKGPFTVFAPTDTAFAKLPAGTVQSLLKDIPTLKDILLYHVVAGKEMASDVEKLSSVTTEEGKSINISVSGGKVLLNNTATVTQTDIECSNGVIHVIDTVLLPPKDIVATATADGRFTTLVSAVQAAGLANTLEGTGPFTVFAPTDNAFAKLPAGTVQSLLNDIPKLKDILLYHVVAGKDMASDVVKLTSVTTEEGKSITISVSGGMVKLNNTATVTQTDIACSNGVIHVIDTVLLPPGS